MSLFKTAFYAMDEVYLEKYANLKDTISLKSIDLSSEEIKRISAEIQTERLNNKNTIFVEDGVAYITVAGPLEPKPDPCAILFDMEMTTYQDIIEASKQAEADSNINSITYLFDTPGGNVVGLFKTADVIRTITKPTTALINGMCASAGYALASQCDTIIGENISNEIGSIGVRTELIDYSEQEKGRGVKRYILTSENAENKAPDIATQEGRDKIVSRLTSLESVFHEYVAVGRNTTIDNIKTNFGRGSVLISREALKVGMIDSIDSELSPVTGKTNQTENTQTKMEDDMADITMSEEQLNKFASDIASKTAESVTTNFNASLEKRDAEAKAENERKAGFTTLLNKYPEQAQMINDEMLKGASASVDFSIKVAEAETARIKALDDHTDGTNDKPLGQGHDGNVGAETDNSGNVLAASLGIKTEVK